MLDLQNARIALVGLGEMGRRFARLIENKNGLEIVAAVDVDPSKVGQELSAVAALKAHSGVRISDDLDFILQEANPDLSIVATTSFITEVFPLIEKCVKSGSHVITPCEEMIYPKARFPQLAKRIDESAKENGVAVLGAGVNPGFFSDTLIITLTGICIDIQRIRSARMNDMSWGPMYSLRQLGVGFTIDEFDKRLTDGTIAGHVGFHESIHMIADSVGWEIEEVRASTKPIVSKTHRKADIGLEVHPGMSAGTSQLAQGIMHGRPVIELELQQQIRPEAEGVQIGDYIWIKGEPEINQAIRPGVSGGTSTAAIVVNQIPKLLKAQPGLYSMKDMLVPSFFIRI